MKSFLRNIVIHTLALFLLSYIIPGVTLEDGFVTLIFGGLILTLMFMLLKPILNVITFPFNVITLGLFSIVTNALILYLLTVFVTGIIIEPFIFEGAEIAGFIIPALEFNTLFTFVASAVTLSAIVAAIRWLID